MMIRVYVNDIFPANVFVNEHTGEILSNPEMIDHWLNGKWFYWLFDFIAYWKATMFVLFDQEPMFVCRVSRKDKSKLKQMKLKLWSRNDHHSLE